VPAIAVQNVLTYLVGMLAVPETTGGVSTSVGLKRCATAASFASWRKISVFPGAG